MLVVSGAEKYEVYDYLGRNLGETEHLERGAYIVLADGKSFKLIVK